MSRSASDAYHSREAQVTLTMLAIRSQITSGTTAQILTCTVSPVIMLQCTSV